MPDGLIASNVPSELNTLDALNRHFRRFGEVLKITVHAGEGRAFVQFADRTAAEAAVGAPVLERSEIIMSWVQRGDKGKSKGKEGKGKGKDRPTHLEKPAEHRVLCSNPEDQRRIDDHKRKRDEIHNQRASLLSKYTEQLKAIMTKLTPDLSEAKRETLRSMILVIKEKMNAISEEAKGADKGEGKSAKHSKGEEGGKGGGGGGKGKAKDEGGGRFTLDLRPKVFRVHVAEGGSQEKIREELTKFGGTEDKILCVHMEGKREDGSPETALVQFKDRRSAEKVFEKKGDMIVGTNAEWCTDVPPASARTEPAPTSTLPNTQAATAPAAEAAGGEAKAEADVPPAAAAAEGGGNGTDAADDAAAKAPADVAAEAGTAGAEGGGKGKVDLEEDEPATN